MLVAVDTNVLLHLTDDVPHVVEAVEVVQKRVRDCRMIATATVIQELAFKATRGETDAGRELAHRTLIETLALFSITPCNLIPVGHPASVWPLAGPPKAGKDCLRNRFARWLLRRSQQTPN